MFINSIIGLTIVALVAADGANNTSNSIDPNTVLASTRSQWCSGEINTCGTLCAGDYDANTCNPDTLTYNCICSSNGSAPGLQYYTQSMPTYICEQVFANCIAAGENDAAAQKVCRENEAKNCGKLDPDKYVAGSSASASSSDAPPTPTAPTSPTTATPSAAASSAAASALNIGREYGVALLAAGISGIFGLMF